MNEWNYQEKMGETLYIILLLLFIFDYSGSSCYISSFWICIISTDVFLLKKIRPHFHFPSLYYSRLRNKNLKPHKLHALSTIN